MAMNPFETMNLPAPSARLPSLIAAQWSKYFHKMYSNSKHPWVRAGIGA
jgi:hypothetical protein